MKKEPTRDVLAALTEALITPTLAKTGEVDEFVSGVKMGVVQHLAKHSGAAKDVLARHFGKSDRWVYRMLSEFKSYLDDQSPESQMGRRKVTSDVLFYIQTHYPDGIGVAECHLHLKDSGWRLSEQDVGGLLDLYTDMNLLEATTTAEGVKYRATSSTNSPVVDSEAYRDRLDMVRDRLGSLTPILTAFVQGESSVVVGHDQASVLPQHFESALTDIRRFTMRRVQQAVLDSLEEDPEERLERVEFCALSVIGRVH